MAVRDEGLDSHFDCYLAEYHSRSNYVNINVDPHLPRRIIENDSAERERERERDLQSLTATSYHGSARIP